MQESLLCTVSCISTVTQSLSTVRTDLPVGTSYSMLRRK